MKKCLCGICWRRISKKEVSRHLAIFHKVGLKEGWFGGGRFVWHTYHRDCENGTNIKKSRKKPPTYKSRITII